jgi:iron complex outermembrane recepter protein
VRRGALAPFTTDFDETYKTFLPKASLAWKLDAQTTIGTALARGYNGGNAGFTFDEPFVSYDYKPESVWTLEGFARANRLDGALQITGNVFYSRYRDMQTPFDLNPDPNVWAYVVRNAPRAETYGAELGARWRVMPSLTLRGDLGLLRARITRYPDSGVEGHELPRSPRASVVLGADWRFANGASVGASARYSSAYHSDITNVARGRVEPGWLLNLSAGLQVGRARLFAFVNNVLDARRPILIEADPNAADDSTDTAMLPRPRAVGVGIEAWF